jgi:hypothetical protein
MKDKQDFEKMSFFKEKYGDHQNAMRVEFRVRGAALRQFFPRKRAFQDVVKGLSRVWRYLTEDWFRILCVPADREGRNTNKQATNFHWSMVQKLFTTTATAVRHSIRKPIPAENLIKQALGCLTTVLAATGQSLASPGQAMLALEKMVRCAFIPLAFSEDYQHQYAAKMAKSLVVF